MAARKGALVGNTMLLSQLQDGVLVRYETDTTVGGQVNSQLE